MVRNFFIALMTCAMCSMSIAQWLPVAVAENAGWFRYEPLCNEKRKQVRVKLIDGTKFTFRSDVQKDTVLYAVRFIDTGKLQLNPPAMGVAYCEPKKVVGFEPQSSTEPIKHLGQIVRSGVNQCLYDYNNDGIFDDASGAIFYTPNNAKVTEDHQYRYEILNIDGPPEPGCPRIVKLANGIIVSQRLWTALSEGEQIFLKSKGDLDIIPSNEIGTVIQAQQINQSTPASNSGALIGERVASANYIDKALNNGTYSAKGQLGAQIVGALIGSTLDARAASAFTTRYTVKTISGEVLTADKISATNEFSLANGICVIFPDMHQVDQHACELDINSFKAKFIPSSLKVDQSNSSKEFRLRELKDLFDRGLVSERVYFDQQKNILGN